MCHVGGDLMSLMF